jgi:integrase
MQKACQAAAGRAWQHTYDLVLTTEAGTPLDLFNVGRSCSHIAGIAGIAHVHPHMLRRAAASLLSAAGVPIDDSSET